MLPQHLQKGSMTAGSKSTLQSQHENMDHQNDETPGRRGVVHGKETARLNHPASKSSIGVGREVTECQPLFPRLPEDWNLLGVCFMQAVVSHLNSNACPLGATRKQLRACTSNALSSLEEEKKHRVHRLNPQAPSWCDRILHCRTGFFSPPPPGRAESRRSATVAGWETDADDAPIQRRAPRSRMDWNGISRELRPKCEKNEALETGWFGLHTVVKGLPPTVQVWFDRTS